MQFIGVISLIKMIIASIIEKSLNAILSLGGDHQHFLQKHSGKSLKLCITDIKLSFYFIVRQDHIYVYTEFSESPDTIIQATSFTFLKQLKSNAVESDLHIEGDVDFAQDLFHLLKGIRFNWEEYLSYFIGDLPTNSIQKFIHQFKDSSHNIIDRSKEDIVEFIQEEQKFIPTREEVDDFYDDVMELRNTIDRLEARWNRLMEQSKNEDI